jgi:hypothetical protein
MTTLRFTDGVSIDTSGSLRTLHLADGWYAVGDGMLIPCASREEAEDEVKRSVDPSGHTEPEETCQLCQPVLTVKYPNVKVKLIGTDGNAYAILGRVQAAMRKAGVPQQDIKEFQVEATSGDYNNLLRTCMRWVEVS